MLLMYSYFEPFYVFARDQKSILWLMKLPRSSENFEMTKLVWNVKIEMKWGEMKLNEETKWFTERRRFISYLIKLLLQFLPPKRPWWGILLLDFLVKRGFEVYNWRPFQFEIVTRVYYLLCKLNIRTLLWRTAWKRLFIVWTKAKCCCTFMKTFGVF